MEKSLFQLQLTYKGMMDAVIVALIRIMPTICLRRLWQYQVAYALLEFLDHIKSALPGKIH
jgi:hypothetical protein